MEVAIRRGHPTHGLWSIATGGAYEKPDQAVVLTGRNVGGFVIGYPAAAGGDSNTALFLRALQGTPIP